MKAIAIENYGNKEELKEINISIPEINENQVLIETYATSVNPVDWKVREGYLKDMFNFEFPIILGWDVAGIVSKVGKKVSKHKIGDKVFSRPDFNDKGTYSEYVVVDENLVAKLPENINFEEGAAVPLAAQTAWQALIDVGDIKKDQKVLIHAGAGGVGIFAIQIAKALGAFVATTGSDNNIDFLKSLGADLVINYREEKFEELVNDYDFVLDSIGGKVQEKSFSVIKKGGLLVTIVSPPSEKLSEKYSVRSEFLFLEPSGERLEKIGKLIEKGNIKIVIGKVFNLTQKDIQSAHDLSQSHHTRGKIVLKVK